MSGTDVMIECVGWTLLHFLWEGLVIAIVAGILLRALRKASANSRYMAGCVALALMIAAPVGTYMQLAKKPAPVSPTVFRMPTEDVVAETTPRIISIQPTKVAATEQKIPAVTLSWSERMTPLLPLLVAGWAMGVIVLALRLSAGWLRVKRLKRLGTEPMEEVWHARLAELTRRLRINRSVRLVKSALVEVPTVIGWLRPIILMPAGCLAGLSAAQVEYILAHELAHVRRHDYLVNLLQCLAETILFYHPAVWWVSRRIREEREHCCDDVAVSVCGNRLEYARTLAALEELRGSQNQLVMAAAGAPLLQRIRRLAGQSERNPSHPVWPVAAIIILTLVATLAIGLRNSRAVADETQGANLKTSHQATAIVKSDSQTQAKVFAGQGSSANQTGPQIHIEAKFFELEERDLPKSIFNLPGASNSVPTSINPTLPNIPKLSSEVLANVTNSIIQSFTGILSEADYRKALKAFKAAHSAEIKSAPSVTTVSGCGAQVLIGDSIPILTNNSPTAIALVPTGVMFDVTPTLPANSTRLQLATMATVTKLMGAPTTVSLPIEVSQLSMDATLEDGQTLVMGGFMAQVVTKMTDKIAVLGSIPLAGRLFRSESVSKSRKYLIVFVTPTLINPDGTRYRPDNETSRKASERQSKPDPGKAPTTTGTNIESSDLNHSTTTNEIRLQKFLSLRIPEVAYREVPLADAIGALNEKIKATGLNSDGMKLVLRTNSFTPDPVLAGGISDNLHFSSLAGTNNEMDYSQWRAATKGGKLVKTYARSTHIVPMKITIDPALKNATVAEVLDAMAKGINASAQFRVEQDQVVIWFKYNLGTPRQKSVAGLDDKVHITIGGTNKLSQGSDFRTNTQEAPKQQNASTLVQDGKLLFESGKSDAAEEKFQEALKLDPNNAAASYYLGLARQKGEHAGDRGELKVVQPMLKWDAATASYSLGGVIPLPNFTLRTNSVKTSKGRQAILSKLDRIRVDSIQYDGLPLAEVINNLSEIAKTRDPDRVGINFFINREAPAAVPGAIDPTTGLPTAAAALTTEPVDVGGVRVKIAPAMTDARLADVLDAITKTSDKPIKYSIEDYAVVFSLKGPETIPLFTRVFHIDVPKFQAVVKKATGQTFDEARDEFWERKKENTPAGPGGIRNMSGNSYDAVQVLIRNFLSRSGLDLDPSKMKNAGKSVFFNDRKSVLMLHGNAEDVEAMERILQDNDVLLPQTQSEENPINTDERATQQAQLPAGVTKTNSVKTVKGRKEIIAALNRIHADSADYEGLSLWDAVKKLSQTTISKDPGYSGVNFFINREAPAQTPLQGGIDPSTGLPRSQPKDGDLGKIVLKPTREQIDVPLIAILDSIATNNSLQYTIEEYAVVFSFKDERAPLYTRVYHVNSDAILKAVESYTNAIVLNPKEPLSTNFSLGDYKLQMALREFLSHSGLDFSPTNPANIGKSLFYKERKGILMVHSTSQDLDLIERVLGKLNPPRPYIQIKTRFVELIERADDQIKLGEMMAGNGVKTNSIQTSAPVSTPVPLRKDPHIGSFPALTNALAVQFTGMLTPEQYKEVMARLEQADGVDVLTAPVVTTESGRQAQIQTAEILTAITGLTTAYTNGTTTNIYSTQNLPFGPTLDIIPKVSEDNSFIEMSLVANVTEFLGYDDPKKLKGQKRTDVQIPLPHFRLRQLTSSVNVLDGQTVVLGGIEPRNAGKPGKKRDTRKTLLVFVTATLINPDGTPYHAKTEQEAALQETK